MLLHVTASTLQKSSVAKVMLLHVTVNLRKAQLTRWCYSMLQQTSEKHSHQGDATYFMIQSSAEKLSHQGDATSSYSQAQKSPVTKVMLLQVTVDFRKAQSPRWCYSMLQSTADKLSYQGDVTSCYSQLQTSSVTNVMLLSSVTKVMLLHVTVNCRQTHLPRWCYFMLESNSEKPSYQDDVTPCYSQLQKSSVTNVMLLCVTVKCKQTQLPWWFYSTAVAPKRSRSLCQKCRWQVTAKHAYTLPMWL